MVLLSAPSSDKAGTLPGALALAEALRMSPQTLLAPDPPEQEGAVARAQKVLELGGWAVV